MPATVRFANPRTSVNNRIRLVGHYTENVPGGMSFGLSMTTVSVSADLTVEMPAPFLPIGNGLAITPVIAPDGDDALRIDLTCWAPLRYGNGAVYRFPFSFTGQDLAVRVARAFDADLRMTWQHTPAEIEAWLRQWGPANGLNLTF